MRILKSSSWWNDLIMNYHPDIKTCNTKCTCRYKYSKHFNSQSFIILVSCWLEPYESCTCIFLESVFNYVIFSRITIKLLQYELIVKSDVTAVNLKMLGRLKWHTSYMKQQINEELNYFEQVLCEEACKLILLSNCTSQSTNNA